MRLGKNQTQAFTSEAALNSPSQNDTSIPIDLLRIAGLGMSLKRAASSGSSEEEEEAKAEFRAAKRRATSRDPEGNVASAAGLPEYASSSLQRIQAGEPDPTLQALTALSASSNSALLENLRVGTRAMLGHTEAYRSLGMASRQDQIQNLLNVGFSATRPLMGANSSLLGPLQGESQTLLAASRFRQAQAQVGLPSLALSNNYSLLPSYPGSSIGFSGLGNLPGASASPNSIESQLRAAQIMAFQSQMAQGGPAGVLRGLHAQMTVGTASGQDLRLESSLAPVPPSPPARPQRTLAPQSPSSKKGSPAETVLAVAGALPPAVPPAEEGSTRHYMDRKDFIISMATDEDQNWLSEFQCFIRSEILEVFRASAEDVQIRNNSKTLQTQQIGIRCRFCAHLPPSARASRSSAFPSSVRQIYQSFTMMLRDHWPACQSIPSPQKEKFLEFKTKNNQGASDSKNYWMHAARRTGMVNTPQGIQIDDESRAAAARIPPFGTNSDTTASLMLERSDTAPMVLPEDKELLRDEYWYVLLQQVQRVRLSASERVGNRKSLKIGLPGFGCRYCCQAGRLGLSRIFPARRRTLPSKIPDIHDHMRRCTLCPQSIKDQLQQLEDARKEQQQQEEGEGKSVAYTAGKEKEFFTRIWSRLGHGNKPEPS